MTEYKIKLPDKKKYCRRCRTDTSYISIQNKNKIYGFKCKVCGEFTSVGLTLGEQCGEVLRNLSVKKKKK